MFSIAASKQPMLYKWNSITVTLWKTIVCAYVCVYVYVNEGVFMCVCSFVKELSSASVHSMVRKIYKEDPCLR